MIVLHTMPVSYQTELSQCQNFELNAKDYQFGLTAEGIEKRMVELSAVGELSSQQQEEWNGLRSQMADLLVKWKAVSQEKAKRNMSRQYVYEDAK